MPNQKKRFCPRGHDKDVVGRSSNRVCKGCIKIKNQRRYPGGRKPKMTEEQRLARRRESAVLWYWRNIERARELNRLAARRWADCNRELTREKTRRRKARSVGVDAVELRHLELLLESQGGKCLYCREPLGPKRHLDHRHPIARGGVHAPDNLAWACVRCNIAKHDRLYPSEWRPTWRMFP